MLSKLGRRHLEQAASFSISAGAYGAAAFTTLCYFTNWKVVVTYIPFYGSQFKDTEEK